MSNKCFCGLYTIDDECSGIIEQTQWKSHRRETCIERAKTYNMTELDWQEVLEARRNSNL